jgi:hypothetical protein
MNHRDKWYTIVPRFCVMLLPTILLIILVVLCDIGARFGRLLVSLDDAVDSNRPMKRFFNNGWKWVRNEPRDNDHE